MSGLLPEAPVDASARAPCAPARRGAGHRRGRRRPGRRAGGRGARAAACCWSTSTTSCSSRPPASRPWRTPPRPASTTTATSCAISATARHDVIHHVRAEQGRARRRRARAAARVRRQRPARRDARLGRTGLPRAFRRPGRAARRRVLDEPCRSRDRRGVARRGRPRRSWSIPPRRWGRRASACARAGIEVHRNAQVVATDGDPALREVTIARRRRPPIDPPADVLAVSGGWNPTVQLARGMGVGLAYDEAKACFVHDGTGPPWLHVVGRRRRRRARGVPDLGDRRRRRRREVRRAAARPDRRRRRARGRRRADERRAREARDLHRHHDRSGAHERGPDRRGRQPTPRLGARRAGSDERAAAVHAGPVLGARRDRRRPDPARPDPRDADPRLARGARRRLRERRPVEAAALLPGRATRTWTPRWRANAARCAPAWACSMRARSARSTSAGPTPACSSIGCTRTGCRTSPSARSATG